jgi:TatA/E family protein of Tat protein translocase
VNRDLGFDDPTVWILIVAAIIFLFGASQIPKFARGLGQARREWNYAMKGEVPPEAASDPLTEAAKKEGIETQGKTRAQISEELALKIGAKKN